MTRVCKVCQIEKRLDEFRYRNSQKVAGWSVGHKCRSCKNARDLDKKKTRYKTDPEFRDRVRAQKSAFHRKWRQDDGNRAYHNMLTSRRCWVDNWCARIDRPWPQSVVMYALQNNNRVGPIRRADRPWTNYRLVFRHERSGMLPPVGGIPVARVTNTRVDWQDDPIILVGVHPTCPDGWRWVAHYVDLWMRKQ